MDAFTPAGPAIADYVRRGRTIWFTHTEVPEAARGGGAAST